MIGPDNYLHAYVDRRMKYIVDEWDLATYTDLSDFTTRLYAIEQEIPRLKAFEHTAADKLTELENRAARLKGRM
ncbi:MAG: hypothetical protein WCH85_03275 [Methanomicrobiales archaeon]